MRPSNDTQAAMTTRVKADAFGLEDTRRRPDPPRQEREVPSPQPSTQPGSPAQSTATSIARRGVVRGHAIAAINVLRTRIAEPWTLSLLAEEVHLSRSQLARSFDAAVGLSPMAYLRHIRVERMTRLLVSTDLSVAEAARSVGWKDPFHASRCFHAAYGISPTEFRRQHTS
jgi:transcriptional regulator GlxA family with amidase domain